MHAVVVMMVVAGMVWAVTVRGAVVEGRLVRMVGTVGRKITGLSILKLMFEA